MSFILDALKKSERERARNEQPSTLELPHGKQRRVTPVWMVIVLVLLLLNCGLLVFMMLRKSNSSQPATPAVTTPAADITPAAPPVLARTPRPVRSLEEEAGIAAAEEDKTDEPAVDEAPATHAAPTYNNNSATSSAARMVTTTANPAAPANNGFTATLESLGGHTALGLPELRLDLHVYAADTKERMVFINGKRYREGEVLGEGPTVAAINSQGAVLAWRGQNFLLPR